jgi:hypothetical protein
MLRVVVTQQVRTVWCKSSVQHAAGLPVHFENARKVFLGLRPPDIGW